MVYTVRSCVIQEKIEKFPDDLPQITNRAEMEEALRGPRKMYAVLKAPVTGTPVDDAFDILTVGAILCYGSV